VLNFGVGVLHRKFEGQKSDRGRYWTRERRDACPNGQHVGMTRDGDHQQFMLARADYVSPLPDALSLTDAAPLMCAGLTVYSGLRHAGFKPGDKVAVVGLGGPQEDPVKTSR
jgi:D-arabinose 1-dehydrogenase-like Zn-dependent alcohol dehydrogenase